jgi:hypothetical protein
MDREEGLEEKAGRGSYRPPERPLPPPEFMLILETLPAIDFLSDLRAAS